MSTVIDVPITMPQSPRYSDLNQQGFLPLPDVVPQEERNETIAVVINDSNALLIIPS